MKRGFWWLVRPTWIKMFLFLVFFFALPTFFKVCSNGCNWLLQRHAGLALWANNAPGQITFSMLFGLMITAYIGSVLVVALFDFIGQMIKKKASELEKEGF